MIKKNKPMQPLLESRTITQPHRGFQRLSAEMEQKSDMLVKYLNAIRSAFAFQHPGQGDRMTPDMTFWFPKLKTGSKITVSLLCASPPARRQPEA